MKLYKSFSHFVIISILIVGTIPQLRAQKTPVDYVNPYMGNISHLLVPTFPTIHLPNSLLRVYPERNDFTGDVLNGLPLIITSHRGSSAFNLSPFQGDVANLQPVITFSYDQEKITPYSYAVYLDEQQTSIDFGLSHQSAIYEIRFEKPAASYLMVNSKNGSMSWTGNALSGFQLIENNTKVYIYLETEQKPVGVSMLKSGKLSSVEKANGKDACMVLQFDGKTPVVRVRYGISFIDADQAKVNMNRELVGYGWKKLQAEGRNEWNKALDKIQAEGGTTDLKTIFYTSLYRTFERPVCISEGGRYYSAFDGKVHNDEGSPFFTDDWIWDSYRAHHPLRVLVDPKVEENILHSFVEMASQMENFWMPTFPEITGDSRRMNSNHGVASVLDAYQKGLRGFDLEKAYRACVGGIEEKTLAPWSGVKGGELNKFFQKNGYIPALREGEAETYPEVHHFERRQPVAVTLGTSFDIWCLSQIAKQLGKTSDYEKYKLQSLNYQNLFNAETGFFHPKDGEGKFIQPFDYVFSGGMGARGFYGENNAWTYRWDVQHNIPDLIKLMGGNEKFVANLDAMFAQPLGRSKFEFYAQLPDQTGNVGQFTMANEPSLHIPYLYNFAGQPWKTQKRIRGLVGEWFRNDLMGVPGDEDGGGMSAFVVFSQMGFYPVTPGLPVYNIGSPFFNTVKIDLGNGKFFEIEAVTNSEDNKYIQSATLNGKALNRCWFTHAELMNGGRLVLQMGNKANLSWGIENLQTNTVMTNDQ